MANGVSFLYIVKSDLNNFKVYAHRELSRWSGLNVK